VNQKKVVSMQARHRTRRGITKEEDKREKTQKKGPKEVPGIRISKEASKKNWKRSRGTPYRGLLIMRVIVERKRRESRRYKRKGLQKEEGNRTIIYRETLRGGKKGEEEAIVGGMLTEQS